MNVAIHYMYRDASNWKNHGVVIVKSRSTNVFRLSAAEERIEEALHEHGVFNAEAVGFENLFYWLDGKRVYEDDHGWHEFVRLSETDQPATDSRTLEEIVAAFEREADKGWEPARVPSPTK